MRRIAAGLAGDEACGGPHVGQRAGKHAEMVHAVGRRERTLPIDRAEGRLQRISAAKARRPDGRTARMGAERGGQHACGNRGRGAARRAARRAPGVERVAGPRRIAAAQAHRNGLADEHRAAVAQRPHTGRIRHRLVGAEKFAAEFRRHVVGLDQVLDADRHAVDRAQRLARFVARPRLISGLACGIEIEEGEGHHRRFERLDALDAALEIGARRVGAVAESRHGIMETQHSVCCRVIGARGRLLVDVQHRFNSGWLWDFATRARQYPNSALR